MRLNNIPFSHCEQRNIQNIANAFFLLKLCEEKKLINSKFNECYHFLAFLSYSHFLAKNIVGFERENLHHKFLKEIIPSELFPNKLASLEATLVRKYHSLTHRGRV